MVDAKRVDPANVVLLARHNGYRRTGAPPGSRQP
jgi:hypothetical protein